jgi:hypothetical protein
MLRAIVVTLRADTEAPQALPELVPVLPVGVSGSNSLLVVICYYFHGKRLFGGVS